MVWVPFAFCISRRLAGWRQTGFAVARLVGSCEDFAWPHCFISSLHLTFPPPPLLFFFPPPKKVDSYSGFFDNFKGRATGLGDELVKRGVTDVYVCGLAYDYCAGSSACDAAELGFVPLFLLSSFLLQYFFNAACPYHGVVVRVTHIWTIC